MAQADFLMSPVTFSNSTRLRNNAACRLFLLVAFRQRMILQRLEARFTGSGNHGTMSQIHCRNRTDDA